MKRVLDSEQEIRNLSSENSEGVREISIGVQEVNEAMQAVNDLNSKLSKAMEELAAGVQIFRTEKSEAASDVS